MKTPALQNDIVAHLRAAAAPASSRDLAASFLKIASADETLCRRLLTPFLGGVPGVAYEEGAGWTWTARRGGPPVAGDVAGGPIVDGGSAPVSDFGSPPTDGAAPAPGDRRPARSLEPEAEGGSLRDFVVLAVDGAGPAGSGAARVASLLPYVAGEECAAACFPAFEEDGEAPPGPARGLTEDDLRDLAETVGDLPIVCHRAGREVDPIRAACAAAGVPFHPRVISVSRLAYLTLGLKANHSLQDLAVALRLGSHGPEDCRGRVLTVAAAWLAMAPDLERRGIDTIDALLEYQAMPAAAVDLSGRAFTLDDVKALPAAPGVYLFLDRHGAVLYVGKAANLRARVGTYFISSARGTPKGAAVLEATHALRCETVASELEALLLEAALIREHRPRLNRQFDVHERTAPYGPRQNLAIVLPDAGGAPGPPPSCTVHFVRGGEYLGRARGLPPPGPEGSLRGAAWAAARRKLDRSFFPEASPAAPGDDGDGEPAVDVDWQLIGSWLKRRGDGCLWMDIDECASAADAAVRMNALAAALFSGAGKVVAR